MLDQPIHVLYQTIHVLDQPIHVFDQPIHVLYQLIHHANLDNFIADNDRARKHGMEEFIALDPVTADHHNMFNDLQKWSLDWRLKDPYASLVSHYLVKYLMIALFLNFHQFLVLLCFIGLVHTWTNLCPG